MPEPSKGKKAFDVTAPGKSAPSATSRPIIVRHGPIMPDPMVQKKQTEEKPEEKVVVIKQSSGGKIMPISDDMKEDKPEVEPKTSEVSQDKSETKDVESKTKAPAETEAAEPQRSSPIKPQDPEEDSKPEPATNSAAAETPAPTSDGAAVVDAIAGSAPDKKLEQQQAHEEEERQAHIQQLIQEKKYFVPLKVSRHKKAGRAVRVLALVLLLAAAGAAVYGYYAGWLELNLF